MKIKIRSVEKSEGKRPLARFAELFCFYAKRNEELDLIMENIRFQREKPKGIGLNRRQELLYSFSKIANAIKALNIFLGRPPTLAEVAEASGEDEQTVARFLRGDYKSIRPEWLPYRVSLESLSDFSASMGEEGKRIILPKKLGRPRKDLENLERRGRPSKGVRMLGEPPWPEALWRGLNESERERLEAYLRSKPFVDLYREILIKQYSLIKILASEKEIVKTDIEDFKPMMERVLQIAERYNSPVLTPEVRQFLSFNWTSDYRLIEYLDKTIELIRTMPDDEFASRIILPSFHGPSSKREELKKKVDEYWARLKSRVKEEAEKEGWEILPWSSRQELKEDAKEAYDEKVLYILTMIWGGELSEVRAETRGDWITLGGLEVARGRSLVKEVEALFEKLAGSEELKKLFEEYSKAKEEG